MAAPLDIGNLVHETSVTTGTGNQTLVAVDGKRTFNTEFGTGGTDVFDYFISNPDATEWERGTGHMSSSTVLVRDTVIESSNGDAAVSFTAGTKIVKNDLPASFHGGQWNLLATVIASTDTFISVAGLTARYYQYVFIWSEAVPSSDSSFNVRTSSNNGSSYDSGASDYARIIHQSSLQTSPIHNFSGDNLDDEMFADVSVGNISNEGSSCILIFANPSAPEFTKFNGVFLHDDGIRKTNGQSAGMRLEAASVNGVQFEMSAGTIATGTLKVYGVRA